MITRLMSQKKQQSMVFALLLSLIVPLYAFSSNTPVDESSKNYAGELKAFVATVFQDTTMFSDVSAGLPGSRAVIWGDYDNDGDLDLLLVGGPDTSAIHHSAIYRNDAGVFHDLGVSLTMGNTAAWGDYDNDNDLDLVIMGPTGFNNQNPVSVIYRNDSGAFVNINAPLAGLAEGSVAWGDFDNDGDLDLLVSGSPENGVTLDVKIYRNDEGTFVDILAALPGIWGSSAAWGDYDNDGDLDILMSGWGGDVGTVNKIFRNDGPSGGPGWVFTDIGVPLYPIANSKVAWGDYDNDGDLDFVFTGTTYSYLGVTKIYRNEGNGLFSDIGASIKQLGFCGLAWGDFDNDGDLDLIISGSEDFFGANPTTKIYRNDGGSFVDVQASLTGTWFASAAWGDYDNDGDLDLILAGSTNSTAPFHFVTKLYRNNLGSNTFTPNTVPTSPSTLASSVSGTTVTLSWVKSTDAQTAQPALTYNLRVGTASAGVQEISPMANTSTGYRKVAQLGNTNHRNSWAIKGLLPGTYYWSVQAMDNAFAGSSFAGEQSFTVTVGPHGPSPYIYSARDVPDDQGGKVMLKWEASSLDVNVNDLRYYSIWRALPEGSQIPTSQNSPGKITERHTGAAYRLTSIGGVTFAWEWIANQPAHRFSTYAYAAPTLSDSMLSADGKHYFLVSAQTADPNVFYDSNVDSGYSVDNLSPSPPQNLIAAYSSPVVTLHWNPNTETDLGHYVLYRSTLPNIDPHASLSLAATSDTFFVDGSPLLNSTSYYLVIAQDIHGNVSSGSNEIAVITTGVVERGDGIPKENALYQNYPNPFNPSTTISFDVKHEGYASLKIFNVAGEEVSTLLSGVLTAGRYTVSFTPGGLASGIYYYRISLRENGTGEPIFNQSKKLLLLK